MELDSKTFDIAEMFSGVSQPTEVVTVYSDAGVAYEFNKLAGEALKAVQARNEDAAKAVEDRREELIEKAEKFRYEIHLRGQSIENRKAVMSKVRSKYPAETDFLNREKANPEADEMFADLMWALHIERIVAPGGGVLVAPEVADVRVMRGNLPDPEVAKIESGIRDLVEGARSGLEALAQEHDFLSSASHEA